LEANVLAGVEPARISEKLAITREVIEAFEKLFFDVRDSLKAGGWLRAYVFTRTPRVSEFKPLRQIWAEVGFGMGERTLDAAIALTTGRGLEPFNEEELESVELALYIDAISPDDYKHLLQLHLRFKAMETGAHPSSFHIPKGAWATTPAVGGSANVGGKVRCSIAELPLWHMKDPRRTIDSVSEGMFGNRWKARNGHRAYYKCCRIRGMPRRIYMGRGIIGRIHELLDRQEWRKLLAFQLARATKKARIVAAEAALNTVIGMARRLFDASMVLSGHYRHGREWRRVRQRARTRQLRESESWEPIQDPWERLAALTNCADHGDAGAMDELQTTMRDGSIVLRLVEAQSRHATQLWRDLVLERIALPETLDLNVDLYRQKLLDGARVPAERAVVEVMVAAKMKRTLANSLEQTTGSEERQRLKLLHAAVRAIQRVQGWLARLHALDLRFSEAAAARGPASTSQPVDTANVA
jgi:hypothetical protein